MSTGTSSPSPNQLRTKPPYPRPLNQPLPSSSRSPPSSLYPPSSSASASASASTSPSYSHSSSSTASSSTHTHHHHQHQQQQRKSHSQTTPQRPRMSRNKSLLQSLGPLNIPVPPSLQNSPLLQSPESIFRRPYPNTRTPGEEEERWLRDTVPMTIGSASSQLPGSSSGSLRRKDAERGACTSTGATSNSPASARSGMPPPSGIGTIPTRNRPEGLPPSSSSTSSTSTSVSGSQSLSFVRVPTTPHPRA